MKTLILSLCMSAIMSGSSYAELNRKIESNPMVEYAQSIMCDGVALVGVMTKPIFGRSQKIAFEKQLQAEIKSYCNVSEVIITFDNDLIYNIKKCAQNGADDNAIKALMQSARKRR